MKRPIPRTAPEPKSDVRAQTRAMLDRRNPKDAVFVARGNEDAMPRVAINVHIIKRPEGTLLTTKAAKAREFAAGRMDDDKMAKALGYPEPKSRAARPGAVAVQARDIRGSVVSEAAASPRGAKRAVEAMGRQVPPGGRVVVVSPLAAHVRRARLRAEEG